MSATHPRILFFGTCWPINMGNAFVNYGAIHALQKACGERATVEHFGGLSSYMFSIRGVGHFSFALGEWVDYDYVVMAGMTQCPDHFEAAEKNLRTYLDRGAKIIIAGGAGRNYDPAEVATVREWMKRLPVEIFISRDSYSYEQYGDLATHAHDGIDSAYFISDAIQPIRFDHNDYIVLNFDESRDPQVINAAPTRTPNTDARPAGRRSRRAMIKSLLTGAPDLTEPKPAPEITIDAKGNRIIRAHHAPMWTRYDQFEQPDTMISDLPSDYLMLYSQAREVHSDRVHACIATLAYGGKARYYHRGEPRMRMFERLGAGTVGTELTQLDPELFAREKQAQIAFLRRSILDAE